MPIEASRSFLGLDFANMDLAAATDWVHAAALGPVMADVITPNVDHMVRLDREGPGALLDAYRNASLCLCDSQILAALAKWKNIDLDVVAGSDLTASVFSSFPPDTSIAIIGGTSDSIADLKAIYPFVRIFQHQPPMGLRQNEAAMRAVLEWIEEVEAPYIFLAVGSPQSELLSHTLKQRGKKAGVALCIGASIDFLTGRQKRAPLVVRRLRLEWAWRLALSPRRLARRYLIDGPRIFRMVWSYRTEPGSPPRR